VTLIHNYLYRELVALTAAIIGVLTFLLVGLELFKVVELILYTDLPLWLTAKFVLLLIPFTLTLTIPTGLLAAVLIVFGRMSSDRELLALKASGIGLAPIVAPVFIIAVLLMLLDFWLIASVNPECRKEYNEMKHEIVTNNPLALFTPEVVLDKIPGWRIYFSQKKGSELEDVILWQLNDQGGVMSALRAERAVIDLDLEHQQLVMTLFNEREEQYPADGDPMNVQPGAHAAQLPVGVSLNSFYEKVQRRLAWMTLPEIQEVIFAMQTAPTGEEASPYLTELQARISFSLACFTFVFVGIPLAIQTQRKETSVGIALTIAIVGIYMLLEAVGRGLKAKAGLYPELIIWAPNIIFQTVGFWLFYRANQK
jgi:lipopolysaccharide export system permease protein